MQEMTITSVHALGPRYAVILKEKDADRYLPILVGASDANAIAIKLHNPQVSLNLTHDLLCTVIDALGGSVRQVLINRDWGLSGLLQPRAAPSSPGLSVTGSGVPSSEPTKVFTGTSTSLTIG